MRLRRMNKIQRRKLTIFFRCVIISFVAWALFAISNTYTYSVFAGIEYVNLPENKAFHPLQTDTVRVGVRMTGWEILVSAFKKDSVSVKADISELKNRSYIVFSDQLEFINKQFKAGNEVVQVAPDTLFFDFSKQTQRKVPIKANLNLKYRKQYNVAGPVKTNPEYVTITGPLEDVAEIESIETDSIQGVDVEADVRAFSYLKRGKKSNITIYPSYAEVFIPVGEITEKILEVPLQIENGQKYTSVRILPSKVSLTVSLPVKDYHKWTASDFEAVVDLEAWEKYKNRSLPVIVTEKPDFTKVIRIHPQNIDFFVRP